MNNLNISILDAMTLGDDVNLQPITQLGKTTIYQTTRPEQVLERCSGQQVVITNKVVLDQSVLNKLPNLKLICVAATGTNNINIEAANELGIEVKNVSDYSTHSVAQHNFAMLLSLMNNINKHHQFVISGSYAKSEIFTCLQWPYYELKGKRYGIIGMGNIGRQVAKIADAFGAEVVYVSLSGAERKENYQQVTLDVLLASCDVIGLHCPLNRYSENLLSDTEFDKLAKKPILVNMARGGIVDEHALVRALDNGKLSGACVDVFAVEPIKSSNPLFSLTDRHNFLLSPHIAWASKEARQKLVEKIALNIESWMI